MKASYRSRCLQGLPGGMASWDAGVPIEGALSIHEQLDAGLAVRRAEARVVRSSFVAKYFGCRQGRVMNEPLGIVEQSLQYPRGGGGLDGPVEVAPEVCGREMHLSIRRVGARTYRRGIGSPHARSRAARGEELGVVESRATKHVLISPHESQLAQNIDGRPIVRRQHSLRHTEIVKNLHLAQPLLGRRLGIRYGVNASLRGEVANR